MNTASDPLPELAYPRLRTTRFAAVLIAIAGAAWAVMPTAIAGQADPIGEPRWSYTMAENPPPANTTGLNTFAGSLFLARVDAARNTVLIIPFAAGVSPMPPFFPNPNGTRVVWINSKGKIRYSDDIAAGSNVSLVSLTPNQVILNVSTGLATTLRTLKFTSASGKVTSSDVALPVNFALLPSEFPPSKGFIITNAASAPLQEIEFRYYP